MTNKNSHPLSVGVTLEEARRRKEARKQKKAHKEKSPKNETLEFDLVSTDFRSAMRRNVRATVFLIAGLITISALVGYTIGWAIEVVSFHHENIDKIQSDHTIWDQAKLLWYSEYGVLGIAITLLLGGLMILFTFWRGDKVLMHLSGAREADPDRDSMIHNLVEEMAIAARLPKPHVFIIETDSLNAFATGIRESQRSVAVTRGMTERLNRDELQAVIGHEMGHLLNGDIRYSVALATLVGLISGLAMLLREASWRLLFYSGGSRGRRSNSPLPLVIPIAILLMLIGVFAPLIATFLKLAVSREREYLADATSVQLTRNPKALASALQKISSNPSVDAAKGATAHLFIECPKPSKITGLFSTHPSIEDRIHRILNLK